MLTDEQLCLLEQLCYLTPDVYKYAGISDGTVISIDTEGWTVGELLEEFGSDELDELRTFTQNDVDVLVENGEGLSGVLDAIEAGGIEEIDGSLASDAEWASIIEAIQADEVLSRLKIDDVLSEDGKCMAICYTDPSGEVTPTVAFKGTTGEYEWYEDAYAMTETDVATQETALAFVNGLPYDEIVVTGHSKGSNKAMYVAILSDKVVKCVSFDGQGFSQEFLDKYWAEIYLKAGIITNYSISVDYVHALGLQIPGSNQIYCEGYGMSNALQYHSPNSFFVTDSEGNLVFNEDGSVQMTTGIEQDSALAWLNQLTLFFMGITDQEERSTVFDMLGNLIADTMMNGGANVVDIISNDPETFAWILAYLAKFEEVNDITEEEFDALIQMVLPDSFLASLGLADDGLLALLKQLQDGKDDLFITALLNLVSLLGFELDIAAIWKIAEEKYQTLSDYDYNANGVGGVVTVAKSRDFTAQTYAELLQVIADFTNNHFSDVLSWDNYASEDWYSGLFIKNTRNYITNYINDIEETNLANKAKITTLFEKVYKVDSEYAKKVDAVTLDINSIQLTVATLSAAINV